MWLCSCGIYRPGQRACRGTERALPPYSDLKGSALALAVLQGHVVKTVSTSGGVLPLESNRMDFNHRCIFGLCKEITWNLQVFVYPFRPTCFHQSHIPLLRFTETNKEHLRFILAFERRSQPLAHLPFVPHSSVLHNVLSDSTTFLRIYF
jgi:hypothetical protein